MKKVRFDKYDLYLFFQEYSVQITFREDWIDPRLEYDDLRGNFIDQKQRQ